MFCPRFSFCPNFCFRSHVYFETKGPSPCFQTILGVVPEVIAAGFYYIDSNYGSDEELLMEQIGVNRRELQALKDKFLQ